MEFSCVKDCSQCCIEREYYPSKKFGKIGVLVMPDEKKHLELLARENNLDVTILPRIGISYDIAETPTEIIAYQMMGKEENGNTCPFLDTETNARSPHGGFLCKIYDKRPLACKAYPLEETNPITLDSKCKFCQNNGNTASNMVEEAEALIKIKVKMSTHAPNIWRYATGIGDIDHADQIKKGWFMES